MQPATIRWQPTATTSISEAVTAGRLLRLQSSSRSTGAFFASVIPRLPELRDDIGVGTAAIGAMLTVASAAGLVSSATCSRVIARFGTRLVLLVGGLLISAALLVVGLASTLPVALVAIAGMFAFDVYEEVAALLR